MTSVGATPARTGRRTWYPALDGLRAVGALCVLLTHVGFHSGASIQGWAAPLLSRLDIGVAIFFVLSGYLLYRPHVVALLDGGPRPATAPYLVHRVLRIVPAYLLVVTAAGVLLLENHQVGWPVWLRTLSFAHIYEPATLVQGLTHTWSLATEVAFYLLLPLLALVAAPRRPAPRETVLRRQVLVVGGCLVAAPAFLTFAAAGMVESPTIGLWLPAYLNWFGLGMGIAVVSAAAQTARDPVTEGTPGRLEYFVETVRHLASEPTSALVAAVLLFAIAATPVAGPRSLEPIGGFESLTKNLLYMAIGGLLVLTAALSPAGLYLGFLASRPMRWLGEISYGIFLYHVVVLEVIRRALGHTTFSGHFWLLAVLTIAVTLPVAWLSYRLVERPIMRWGHARVG